MISGEFTRKVDVDAEILITPIRTLYASGDKNAHTFELALYRNKEPLNIDGAGVIGYFLRADGYTVPVSGTASGNVAKVTLAESCYTVVGQFNLIIKVTVGSERKAVFWGNGYVTRSQTDSIIDPGKTIPSLDELLAQIAAVEAATKAANTAASTANTAASNANTKAGLANTAASTANASAKTANASAAAADKATASASAAAGKIDGMTVSATGLPAGTAPTAKLTEESGHYKLALGVPKGNTGASGVYTGPDEPTDPDIDVWINPDGTPTDVEMLAARQNILIGSTNGNPVSVSDAFAAPLCGLHIYGRSRQGGTPSADNPVEIIGAGADGTLQVKITGANLLDFDAISLAAQNTTSFTYENETLTVKALSTQGYAGINIPLPDECAGKNIYFVRTITSNPNGLNALIQIVYKLNGRNYYNSTKNPLSIPEGATNITYNVMARNSATATEGTVTVERPVACYGDKLLPYEPYHEQVITVQTSGGLHGIPVSSGGNFVDENGQRWVCDEIDFEQGKLIKRVNVEALDTTKALSEQSDFEMEPVETPLTAEEIAAYKALTAYAQTTVVQAKNVAGIELDYQRDVNPVIQGLESDVKDLEKAVTPLSELEILWQVADHIYQGADLTTKFADEIKNYANPWAWIKARIAAGDYTGVHVCDYIPMTTDNGLTFEMQVAGIDTYTRYGSPEVGHHIDFIAKTLWSKTVQMNLVDFNNGVSDAVKSPWLASNAYHYINSLAGSVPNSKAVNPELVAVDYTNDGIYSHLPAEAKAVIAEKIAYLPTRYDASGLRSSDNGGEWKSVGKLWIPAEFEVLGAYNVTSLGWMAGGWQQYPIFASSMNRVKGVSKASRNGWWLLSANSGSNTGFADMAGGGFSSNGGASSAYYVPICFRIS